MLKRTVVILAAAALLGATALTQTARADNDDIWDMMDPSWWADEIFDNDDDDDWWRYQRYRYSPYWGGPYGWQRPPVIVIQQPPQTEQQNPGTRPPE